MRLWALPIERQCWILSLEPWSELGLGFSLLLGVGWGALLSLSFPASLSGKSSSSTAAGQLQCGIHDTGLCHISSWVWNTSYPITTCSETPTYWPQVTLTEQGNGMPAFSQRWLQVPREPCVWSFWDACLKAVRTWIMHVIETDAVADYNPRT